MKKVIALILCGVMLLTLAVGCKKKETGTPEVLDDNRIATDLYKNRHLYAFSHMDTAPSISALKIVEKDEKDDSASLSVTATALNPFGTVEVAADMKYVREGLLWTLDKIEVTKAVPTPTAAPDQESVMSDLTNYINIVGSAYSVMDDTYQPLYFNINDSTVEMQYESGAKTAALKLAYTSDKLTFEGTYTLTFDEESGWHFETVKQADGRQHPLLRLTKLEQKK